MRFTGHAFVDWDDTVAENIRYFNEAEEANSRLIARLTGSDAASVHNRGQELDLAVARRIGLGKESFGTAWCDCYREFCAGAGQEPDPETEEAIWAACLMPYVVKQGLHAGAAETLAWLGERGFEVTIWTAGDHDVQSRKIAESGLSHLIHRAEIVPDKTPDRLLAALGGRDLSLSFVVGNSIHSDIRPALAVGIPAFHIAVETWAYDHGHLDLSDSNYHRIAGIHEVPQVVGHRFRLAV